MNMKSLTRLIHVVMLLSLNAGTGFAQDLDRYFLGIPYKKSRDRQIAFIRSDTRFNSTSAKNIMPLTFFYAKLSDARIADSVCDSVTVIVTEILYSSSLSEDAGSRVYRADEIEIVFHYPNREFQARKFAELEKVLLEKKFRTAYVTIGDETTRAEGRMKGAEFMLTKKQFPKITLMQTTQDGHYNVRLGYSKVNK